MAGGKCLRCKQSGKCPECYGTGQNTRLNVPGDICEACKGSGKCTVCGGREPKNPITKLLLWLRGDD